MLMHMIALFRIAAAPQGERALPRRIDGACCEYPWRGGPEHHVDVCRADPQRPL